MHLHIHSIIQTQISRHFTTEKQKKIAEYCESVHHFFLFIQVCRLLNKFCCHKRIKLVLVCFGFFVTFNSSRKIHNTKDFVISLELLIHRNALVIKTRAGIRSKNVVGGYNDRSFYGLCFKIILALQAVHCKCFVCRNHRRMPANQVQRQLAVILTKAM